MSETHCIASLLGECLKRIAERLTENRKSPLVGVEKDIMDFRDVVSSICSNCDNATADFWNAIALQFEDLGKRFSQVDLPAIDLIIRLYGIRVSTIDLAYYSRGSGTPEQPKAESGKILLHVGNRLQSLGCQLIADVGTYVSCSSNALKFLYEPLSYLILSRPEYEHLLLRSGDKPVSIELSHCKCISTVYNYFRGLLYISRFCGG